MSMPPRVLNKQEIPIAYYGKSDNARMKRVYRIGLANRYGRVMQAIAGLHYNVSFPQDFFDAIRPEGAENSQAFRSSVYMSIVRNFHRYAWFLPYFFGASPVCFDTSLPKDCVPDYLARLDEETYVGRYATSLRMSDLGYQNQAQASLKLDFSSVEAYAHSLRAATETPYDEFEALGVREGDRYRQLNANILQIENEFYNYIRPKPKAVTGQRPTVSLLEQGVDYLEIRLLDLNPFLPVGVDEATLAFIDLFLLYCYCVEGEEPLGISPHHARENFLRVATLGRKPGLNVLTEQGEVPFYTLAKVMLDDMQVLAECMDRFSVDKIYSKALAVQAERLENPELTPSGKLLKYLHEESLSYRDLCFLCAEKQATDVGEGQIDIEFEKKLQASVSLSQRAWQELESQSHDFEGFLTHYYGRANSKLRVAVMMDSFERLSLYKDSSVLLIQSALARNSEVAVFDTDGLSQDEQGVYAKVKWIKHICHETSQFELARSSRESLSSFDVILIRKDPPFDMRYVLSTYLLENVKGPLVLNAPRSLRDCNEKAWILSFPHCIAETLLTGDSNEALAFVKKYKKAVIKPLTAMGGRGVSCVVSDDLVKAQQAITALLAEEGFIMLQRFLENVYTGDKRIILIDGEPLEYAVLRLPKSGEFRANLAQGGHFKIVALSERDRYLCAQIAPALKERGLFLVGLDVVDGHITEINVTSPTCLRELSENTALDPGEIFWDKVAVFLAEKT